MTKKELKPWLPIALEKVKSKTDFVTYIKVFEYGIYLCLAIKFGRKTFMSWTENQKEHLYNLVRGWLIQNGVAEDGGRGIFNSSQVTYYKDGWKEMLAELAFNDDYAFRKQEE